MNVYEVHITVDTSSIVHFELFIKTCEQLKVKPIVIELESGEYPKQCMTSSYKKGTFDSAKIYAGQLSHELENCGFKILRAKIEGRLSNSDVPFGFDGFIENGRYCEFHHKVKISNISALADLRSVAKKHSAHVSSNAYKRFKNGAMKYFVTLRAANMLIVDAEKLNSLLLEDLKPFNSEKMSFDSEYVMYDSNLDLDRGWK